MAAEMAGVTERLIEMGACWKKSAGVGRSPFVFTVPTQAFAHHLRVALEHHIGISDKTAGKSF